MQVEKKLVNQFTVELTIKESSSEYKKAKEKVMSNLRNNASVDWFRKWTNIPEEILIKRFWEDYIKDETVNMILNQNYSKILKKENILPTSQWVIKEIKSLEPFEVVVEIEILPQIEIKESELKKIKIKKEEVKIDEKDIDDRISQIEKKFTKYEISENTTIDNWDKVIVDTIWFDEKWWKELENTRVKAFPLIIGSWSFIPGFEDKLIWSKAGDIVEFDITFPTEYHSPDFAWRKVFFLTTIFSVEKSTKPQWTEEFIEQLRWVKTDFNWFKEIIKKEITEEKERESRLKDEDKLLIELEKISTIELWENLLKHEIDKIYNEHVESLESQWMQIKYYLEHIKKDVDSYKEEVIKSEAIKRLKAELILEKLKEIIIVELWEGEVDSEIDKIMNQFSNEEVKERLKLKLIPWDGYYEDIVSRLKYRKIIDTFYE